MVKAWALVEKLDRRWIFGLSGALGLYLAWIVIEPSSSSRALVALLMLVAFQSVAAVLATFTARNSPSASAKRSWRFFGIALMLWLLSHALEAAGIGFSGAIGNPPTAADLLRMGGYFSAIAGVVSYPVSAPEHFGKVREVFNVSIVTLAVLCLAWLVFIRPVVALGVAPVATIYWASIRPFLDLVLLALLLRVTLLISDENGRRVFRWLLAAIGLIAVSDFWLGLSMLFDSRQVGAFAEAGWMAGSLGFMMAALASGQTFSSPFLFITTRLSRIAERLIPIIFTYAVVGFTVFDWFFSGRPDYVGVAVSVLISLMLVARQGVIVGQRELRGAFQQVDEARAQLENLNLDLEEKVEVRTRELETMLRNLAAVNEELKQLDTLKTEFIALVSHELRAPLTNIKGGLEVLLKKTVDPGYSANQSIGLIQQEVDRLAGFVEKILDVSALESGKFPINLTSIPLDEIARQACNGFINISGDRLKVSMPSDLPDVMADEGALKSIFVHLIDNALKYAPEGEIRIEASELNGEVRVAIIDMGPGIPERERDRAFEIFHRMDASDSREVYGYGLGLHLSKRLIEEMQGQIYAEETGGGGASLIFTLPKS
jgi:signal transduction histidine kinase